MSAKLRTELRVVALSRSLLDGIDDPDDPDDPERRRELDLAVVPWFEDERPLQGLAGLLDWRSNGRISSLLRSGFCTGQLGEAVLMPWRHGTLMRRIILVGFGRSSNLTEEVAVDATIRAVEKARRALPRDVLFAIPDPVQARGPVEAIFSGLCRALQPGVEGPTRGVARLRSVSEAKGEPSEGPEESDALAPVAELHPVAPQWWIVVAERHVARLRRLAEGPPRAAES